MKKQGWIQTCLPCCVTSGQGKSRSKGAYPGDRGSQTGPGAGLSGVLVQPQLNTREGAGSWWEATEAAPHSPGELEGMLAAVSSVISFQQSRAIWSMILRRRHVNQCDPCFNSRCCTLTSAPAWWTQKVPPWRQRSKCSRTTAVSVHTCITVWVSHSALIITALTALLVEKSGS